MKEQLMTMLMAHPLSKGQSKEFLDDLAEDIMAMIIRALDPCRGALLKQRLDELTGKKDYTIN